MIYRIRYIGDPVLRKQSQPILQFDQTLEEMVRKMTEIMYKEDGIGLAAPQIGISKQLLIIDVSPLARGETLTVYINPQILDSSEESTMEEGCLSIPGVREDVIRPKNIKLKYQDVFGKEYTAEYTGWPARVLQHEIDHLNGILFVDRISPIKRNMLINKAKLPAVY